MAAWGYEFYLLVLKVSLTSEDKIRIPARPCSVLYVNLTEPISATFSSYTLLLVSERVFRVSTLG